jgi:hypothetical protein
MTEFVEGQQPAADEAQISADEGARPPIEGQQPAHEAADPFEDVAREHGWTPKEEWRGKPDDWRGPREFVAYGMKRSRESADEMKSMRSELKSIGRVAEVIQRRAVEDARRDVEQRFADAVEQKDHEGARAAREELSRIDREASAPAQDEVQAFMNRNAWFNQNRGATLIAQGVTAQLAQQGVSVSEQLRQAEEAVRAEMPHLFGQGQAPAKPPASVSAPQTRAAQPSARAKGFADLPANAQAAGRDFVKRGMVKNLEDYARVYLEENA